MRRGLLVLLVLLLPVGQGIAASKTVYVHDQLRLGVRAEAKSDDKPITVVTTGDALEVLAEQDSYLNVRTASGIEGWVNKAYVSEEPPARERLRQLQQRYDTLQQEHADLQQQLTAMRQQSQSEQQHLEKTQQQVQTEQQRLEQENIRLREALQNSESAPASASTVAVSGGESRSWNWVWWALLLAFALFIIGVAMGVKWNKHRVAERIGGLEI